MQDPVQGRERNDVPWPSPSARDPTTGPAAGADLDNRDIALVAGALLLLVVGPLPWYLRWLADGNLTDATPLQLYLIAVGQALGAS